MWRSARYQDMKADLSATVDRIAEFLQWHISSDQKEKVLEYSSFDWMKKHDEKFSNQGSAKKPIFKPGKFVRQGGVGTYHELMTAAQEKRILDKAHEMLELDCLAFLELD